MSPPWSWSEYFETFERTNAIEEKLEAFCAGKETTESLEEWARALWDVDGTEAGPVRTNGLATGTLINLWNADSREVPTDPGSPPILRKADALRYLQDLREGTSSRMPRMLASVADPLSIWATRLRVEPLRAVLDGIGWVAYLRFASPGTGRSFVMRQGLEEHSAGDPTIFSEVDGTELVCLVDLLETLHIDRTDLTWLADEFAEVALPHWVVWRQDDNGIRAEVAVFTGRHKAKAAMSKLEASKHKQTYWLEERPPAE